MYDAAPEQNARSLPTAGILFTRPFRPDCGTASVLRCAFVNRAVTLRADDDRRGIGARSRAWLLRRGCGGARRRFSAIAACESRRSNSSRKQQGKRSGSHKGLLKSLNERLMRERMCIAWRLSVFTDYQKSILIETIYYCYSNNNDESIHLVFRMQSTFTAEKTARRRFQVKHGPQRGQNPRKYSKTDGFASCGMIEPDIIRRDMVTSADACGAKTIQDRAPHFAG